MTLRPEEIARSRIIAIGPGIRDLPRLLATYGGKARRWKKKASPPRRDNRGWYEYHWYEHHGIGRKEVKQKRLESE